MFCKFQLFLPKDGLVGKGLTMAVFMLVGSQPEDNEALMRLVIIVNLSSRYSRIRNVGM